MEHVITSWPLLFGYTWQEAWTTDPNDELGLSKTQRDALDQACAAHLEAEASRIIRRIDSSSYVSWGHVIAEADSPLATLEDWSAVKEEIQMINFDAILLTVEAGEWDEGGRY